MGAGYQEIAKMLEFSAALQTNRKCGRYAFNTQRVDI